MMRHLFLVRRGDDVSSDRWRIRDCPHGARPSEDPCACVHTLRGVYTEGGAEEFAQSGQGEMRHLSCEGEDDRLFPDVMALWR